jgi:putative transposase
MNCKSSATYSCLSTCTLVSEPEKKELSTAIQALKQSVSRRVALRAKEPFWQARYYDFNVRSQRKFIEKIRYMHRNPVVRRLVRRPEDWPWSSFVHYATGARGIVEIESDWTNRWREKMGNPLVVKIRKPTTPP